MKTNLFLFTMLWMLNLSAFNVKSKADEEPIHKSLNDTLGLTGGIMNSLPQAEHKLCIIHQNRVSTKIFADLKNKHKIIEHE